MSLHKTVRAKQQSAAEQRGRKAGYKTGGAVSPEAAVHKHEKHLHKGQPETKFKKSNRVERKSGGAVEGKKARTHLGKRARGGDVSDMIGGDRKKIAQPTTNIDKEVAVPQRKRGGSVPGKGKINIIINTAEKKEPDPLAAMAALKAAAPPPGAMPPMPPGPPPGMGAPGPGPMPPMGPPMRARGGSITKDPAAGELKMRQAGEGRLNHMKAAKERKGEIQVRAHTRKRGGACS